MGRFFALTLHMVGETKPKTKRITTSKEVGFKRSNLALWLMGVIVVFGILYVIEVNNISTKGYEIKKLEKTLGELQDSQKKLELEASSLKSMQNIETEVKTLNLVPSNEVKYLTRQGYAFESK